MHRADRQFVLTSIYVICTLIVTFAAMFAQANNYYVSTSGIDDNAAGRGQSSGNPWRTITYAMDHVPTNGTAANPHIVHVAPGTYTYATGGSHNEEFPIRWADTSTRVLQYVHLVGDDVDTTIIDYGDWPPEGEYEEGILEAWIENVYLNGVTIESLTIRNGVAEEADGGQIYIRNAEAHITGCVIEYGWGRLRGGGIFAEDADLFVTDCTLQRNKSNYGGGIACVNSTVDIEDCLVQDNETFYQDAGPHGGGIFMSGCGNDCLIRDCNILDNNADPDGGNGDGGGIYLIDSSPHIAHNQIRAAVSNYHVGPGNTARSGAGIYMTGNSDPLIDEWNKIAENHAAMNGGGIYANLGSSTPDIEGNEVFWNKALDGNGGGLYSNKANLVVRSNYITANEAHGAASESKGSGGGIYCLEGSGSVHSSIYDINWISDNQADNLGGGICFLNGVAASRLRNNNIWANRSGDGDGVYLGQSNGLSLRDNGIWDNGTATNPGEGIRVDGGTATLLNNLVFSSTSNDSQAIGVYVRGSASLTIKNLTIADHSDYGINAASGSVWIWDSIIWGNATSITGSGTVEVFYTDIQGGWGGTGSNNKNQDPLFVPLSGARGAPVGYFLSQTAAGQGSNSPCVDTGSTGVSSVFTSSDYPVIPCTRTDAVSDTGQVDMGYHYLRNGATYIELNTFEAKGLNEKVLVTWTTGTEIDNAGFDIYRKEDGSSNLVKVNGSLIPAQGTLGGGASYSFMDTNVAAGTKYLYYLVDIDANGRTTAHGPVSAAPYSVRVPSLHACDGGARENAAPNMTKLTAK